MKKKELKKLELLLGFVNSVAEIVCSPDEYMYSNCKSSTTLSLGYSLDKENNPVIETIECEDTISSLKMTLDDLYGLVKCKSKVDFSEQWHELQK